ncbi:MAG TPA: LCP family protein [Bacillota bacterium]|nr:LCP family protein [Bacillota bacterium]
MGKVLRCRLAPSTHMMAVNGVMSVRRLIGLLTLISLFSLYVGATGYFDSAPEPGIIRSVVSAQGRGVFTDLTKTGKSFNVLILGVDSPTVKGARPDLIMLGQFDPDQKNIRLISIPRDTRVKVAGVGYTKINHANVIGEARGGEQLGTKLTSQAVSDLLGTEVNYYVKMDVQGFKQFIDGLGGLELELAQPLKLTDYNKTLPAGKQHLNGEETLKLVQERYSLEGGDFDRQRNQFKVLKALALKVRNPENLSELSKTIEHLRGCVIDTNLSTDEMVSLALLLRQIQLEDIAYYQIPGRGLYEYDPLIKARLYYWQPDMTKLRSDKV